MNLMGGSGQGWGRVPRAPRGYATEYYTKNISFYVMLIYCKQISWFYGEWLAFILFIYFMIYLKQR